VSALPHKFFHTGKHSYLYLPFNNRFYQLDDCCIETLSAWLHGDTATHTTVPSDSLGTFLAGHPEIREAFTNYQEFDFHNPITTTGYRQAITDHLTTCVLCVTEQCNLRCSYCCYSEHYPQSPNFSNNTMRNEVARQAVDFLFTHSRKTSSELTLGFYGGEPMINYPLIRNTVAYAKEIFGDQILFTMTTNATLLNQEKIDFLIENNFGLTVSLDGDQQSTDRYRKYWKEPGSVFESVLTSVRMIREADPDYFQNRVIFNSVLSGPLDLDSLEETFIERLGTQAVNVGLSTISAEHTDFFEHHPLANQYDDVLNQAEDAYYKKLAEGIGSDKRQSIAFYHFLRGATIRISKRPDKPLNETIPFPTGQCIPMVFQTYIRPNGDTYICEKFEGNSVGNVFDGIDIDVVEALFQPYYQDTTKTCKQCWVQRLCSNCIVECISNGAFNPEMKRSACENERASYEHSIIRYLDTLEKNPSALDILDNWSYE